MSRIRYLVVAAILVTTMWAKAGSPVSSGPAAPNPPNGNQEQPASEITQATPDSTGLVATKVIKPIYPIKAEQDKLEGQVLVKIAISETGDVDNVEVVSGNPRLAQAASDAAKQVEVQAVHSEWQGD